MNQYTKINSQLEALKLKDMENNFYKNIDDNATIIPKITPFKGINIDMLYIKDNKLLFIKFMDTTQDLFFILEEELLEVMNEEYELLKTKMEQLNLNIEYNYVFVLPYVDIDTDNKYEFRDFIEYNLIDKTKFKEILKDKNLINRYLKDKNNEIDLNLFLLNICPEYYVLNDKINLNNKLKRISFYSENYEYSATPLSEEQISDIISINYGNTLFSGGSGKGKTTIMLSKVLKLSKVYPHHKFLILTHTKQESNDLREKLQVIYKENNNIDISTFTNLPIKLVSSVVKFTSLFCLVLPINLFHQFYFYLQLKLQLLYLYNFGLSLLLFH